MKNVVGWVSAGLLLVTVLSQVVKQWRSGEPDDESPVYFCAQFLASSGLLVYSVLSDDLVFVTINAAMAAAAVVGFCLWWRNRRKDGATPYPASAVGSSRGLRPGPSGRRRRAG